MAYQGKPRAGGKSPSYYEKAFTPPPKRVKISNKKLNELPSHGELKRELEGGKDEDKYAPKRVDFSTIRKNKDARFGGSDKPSYGNRGSRNSSNDRPRYNNDRPSYGDRNNSGERRPFNIDRNREGGAERKPFNSDRPSYGDRNNSGERRPFNNDRNREGGAERKPFNSDRPSYGDRNNSGERRPFNNDRNREGGAERRPFNNDRREGGYENKPFANKNFGVRVPDENWREKEENARKEYSQRGGYKGRPENKIEGFGQKPTFNKKPSMGPYVNARGDMYQDDAIEYAHNITNKRREEVEESDNGQMPLNKFVAHCGICSRREAADVVKSGKVYVNDKVETNPAYRVQETDKISMDGKPMLRQSNLMYVLLNKPKDFITTSEDPEGRKTVMDLVANATTDERIYPVGRLDRNTSGLLLLTNDGELAQKLSHPKYSVQKLYQVNLDKPLTKEHFSAIKAGVELEDGLVEVDDVSLTAEGDPSKIGIQIHSGRNRVVRRLFESLGYEVEQLDRVMYANLTKKNLPRGSWRYLNPTEVKFLKHFNSKA